jgi:hypothetical protein
MKLDSDPQHYHSSLSPSLSLTGVQTTVRAEPRTSNEWLTERLASGTEQRPFPSCPSASVPWPHVRTVEGHILLHLLFRFAIHLGHRVLHSLHICIPLQAEKQRRELVSLLRLGSTFRQTSG